MTQSKHALQVNEAVRPGIDPEQWMPISIASASVGISKDAMYKLLRSYPEIKAKYCKKIRINGQPVTHIQNKGIVVLFTTKDDRRDLHTVEADYNVSKSKKAKQQLAETAINSADMVNIPKQIYFDMVSRMQGIENTLIELKNTLALPANAVPEYEKRLDELEFAVKPFEKNLMTDSQRKYLNSKVREYGVKTGHEIRDVWIYIHNLLGKSSVDKYSAFDYSTAIGILRRRYLSIGLAWKTPIEEDRIEY